MKKKIYKKNAMCDNCGHSWVVAIPVGVEVFQSTGGIKDGDKCDNCGCVLQEKERWYSFGDTRNWEFTT